MYEEHGFNRPPLASLRFIAYIRKSTDDNVNQAASIEDQKKWRDDIQRQLGLTIVDTIEEKLTASIPGRPGYGELVSEIQSNIADGILSWAINRLTRNPVDTGSLSWLLQEGACKAVVTSHRVYYSNDNMTTLAVEGSESSEFVRNLKHGVRRGLDSKLAAGWFPGAAPLGYLNDPTGVQGKREIFVDEARWVSVRRIWDLALTGLYSSQGIANIVSDSGLTTRAGNRLRKSNILSILTNCFYTGNFLMKGQTFKGSHKPMVTHAEFDRVQRILGSKGRPRVARHSFAFTNLIRCGECGCFITAETKSRHVKRTGRVHDYTYYRCTKQRGRCSQPTIRVEVLEAQIIEVLASVGIDERVLPFMERVMARQQTHDSKRLVAEAKQLATRLTGLEQELYNLQKTYTKGTLDDDFFITEKQKLTGEIERAKADLVDARGKAPERRTERAMTAFKFASRAMHAFHQADLTTKRAILQSLGTRLTLTDRRFSLELATWLAPLATTPGRALAVSLRSAAKILSETQTGHGVRTVTRADSPLLLRGIVDVIANWYTLASDVRSAAAFQNDESIPELAPATQLAWWAVFGRVAPAEGGGPKLRALRDRMTDSDVARLVALRKQGLNYQQLQAEFHIGRTSIKNILRQVKDGSWRGFDK